MANVFDVATYILQKKGKLSTMKLQKLCYYAQAWSLVWDDEPLFEEEFHAWENGPVCRKLFDRTKGRFSVEAKDEKGDISKITEEQKETIDKVLEHYGNHDAQWLSSLTHIEEPWKIARANFTNGKSDIITKESMAMYYGGL